LENEKDATVVVQPLAGDDNIRWTVRSIHLLRLCRATDPWGSTPGFSGPDAPAGASTPVGLLARQRAPTAPGFC
jgi:hypothetical protein